MMFYREKDVMETLSEIYVDVMGSPVAERTLLRIKQTIKELETVDAAPVVRCGECRWWDRIETSPLGYCHACKHGHYSSHWEISIRRTYTEDWFCADGDRKEKDGDEDG